MTCIDKIYSISAIVGNGRCNANCPHCAGRYLRQCAENHLSPQDEFHYNRTLETAIKLCARYGGWSLSLTSSGEPSSDPESVTRALQVYDKCAKQGAYLPNINLFTNGINFGNKDFCDVYLPVWRSLGLTNVAISILHPKHQAEAYNVKSYPYISTIVDNIRTYGVGVRATLLLSKKYINSAKEYVNAINYLTQFCDVHNITSWSISNPDGTRNEFSPSRLGLLSIRNWLFWNAKFTHGHQWGGGVWEYNENILRLTDYVTKHDPTKNFVRQLVVFQDGSVYYSWIKDGAICMV